MKQGNYVWYASYGSNLSKERFMCYIKGGVCKYNGRKYNGCTDKSDPLADRPITIPYRMYFAKNSGSWQNGGVAFISPFRDPKEKTLGRMYLITGQQFEEVCRQEGPVWYGHIIELGEADGYKIKTITNPRILERTMPSAAYLNVIRDGLKETYPDMDEWDIEEYLDYCINTPVVRAI